MHSLSHPKIEYMYLLSADYQPMSIEDIYLSIFHSSQHLYVDLLVADWLRQMEVCMQPNRPQFVEEEFARCLLEWYSVIQPEPWEI